MSARERQLRGRGSVTSVERGAQILHLFLPRRRSLAVTEVADRLGVANSTAHRLLQALCRSGLLQQNSATKRYELSLLLYKLGNLALTNSALHHGALLPLDELYRATGQGCHVAVPDLPQVLYVERRDSDQTMRFLTRMGALAPANCTSTGKVLLAFASQPMLEEVLAHGLGRLTRCSITDSARLSDELQTIRERGYTLSRDEMELGTTSAAAPIRDSDGRVVAALGVAGPTRDMERLSLVRVVAFVLDHSRKISENLSLVKRVGSSFATPFPHDGNAGVLGT